MHFRRRFDNWNRFLAIRPYSTGARLGIRWFSLIFTIPDWMGSLPSGNLLRSATLNMAHLEIVDLPIKTGDFPVRYVNVYHSVILDVFGATTMEHHPSLSDDMKLLDYQRMTMIHSGSWPLLNQPRFWGIVASIGEYEPYCMYITLYNHIEINILIISPLYIYI